MDPPLFGFQCPLSLHVVLFRSLQTIFKVKGFMELWWLWTRPLTQTPWPKPWGSPATNTCCIGTCMKRLNHSPSLTGRLRNPRLSLHTFRFLPTLKVTSDFFLSLILKTHPLQLFNYYLKIRLLMLWKSMNTSCYALCSQRCRAGQWGFKFIFTSGC